MRLGLVRLVLVDLDGDRHRFGFVRVAMVVTMLAIRAVNMGCRSRVRNGTSHRMRVSRAKAVATCAVGPGFRLKRFLGGLVPTSSSKAFETLTPKTLPAIRADAAVAFNRSDDSLVFRDDGKLTTLIRSADGRYDIGTTRNFDDRQSAVIATGGQFVLTAMADGKLSVVD